ncbi:Phosphate-binding protein PstS [Methanimicrococcus sp. At1]|uniref:Phosphate-binding protein PstS n=1 Tax=Methanimicrococcus hacksteinii TaxID=3028293 RepID=A0ABU3VM92_9EURY|nr:PstS family phosphate ABC transporter substrate-binding protein [Methanimicrococcus sp. At1]MDV0444524.1 Phosphate-binding protein PstS [Methanimicrococcus sp. At1]
MKTFKIKNKNHAKISTTQITALLAILLLTFFGAGCLGQNTDDGTIAVSGSTSVLPLAQTLSENYMRENTDVIISVKGGGSGTGIAELIDGSNNIAMSSREIKDSEISNAGAKGINPVEHEIAKDGIAVIIHPSNPVPALTLDQLQKIYSGEIKNWKEVGGEDAEIAAIARDSSSGTQEFFKEAVMGEISFRNDLITQSATGAVTQEVSQNPKAVGFIGAAYQNNAVKTVGIESGGTTVTPTEENILNGKYPLSRSLYLYTDKNTKTAASEFIEYILSADGQKVVSEMGYAPLKKA